MERKAERLSFPLTEAQRGVYFECSEDPESTMYNIAYMLTLPVSVDPDRFEEAVKKEAERHPALFVTVHMAEDGPVMIPGECRCNVTRSEASCAEEAAAGFVRPFDLENGPLYRFNICTVPDGAVFLLDVHHVVFDGTSLRLMLDSISKAYDGAELPEENVTLFDTAEREKTLKESAEYREAQKFFKEQLENVEFENEIISDVSFPEQESGAGFTMLDSPAGLGHDAVESFTKKTGVTEGTFFTAAFAYALSVFTGCADSCFATVCAGRHMEGVKETAGMFVKTLPLCLKIPETGDVAGFLSKTQEVFHKTVKSSCISFGELAAEYGVNTNVSFVYQGKLLGGISIGGQTAALEEIPNGDSSSDLLCWVAKTGAGYRMYTHYRRRCFTGGMAESITDTVFAVAQSMMRCERLEEISLLSDSRRQFIDAFNCTGMPYDTDETVNSVFDRTVRDCPDRIALSYEGREYTFAEFDRLTNNIAAFISSKGIGCDDFVAVLAPRNDMAVIACWGVIRSGAAFQALDSAYPAERLDYMVSDSGAKLLIADRKLRPMLEKYTGEVLYTDELCALPDALGFHADVRPESALTVIYTSGTTGRPKGCVLENRNLLAFFYNHRAVMGLDADSRTASYASFGFDAGIMDIITSALAGGTLYIIPDEIRLDLGRVEEFYRANGITHGFMTTQVGRMFAEETSCVTLKTFMVGGEKLVPFIPPERFRFVNGYGPCETMAHICHYYVRDNGRVQPIGKPGINTKLYVSDRNGRLIPPGAPGELCISGRQVGRGYIGLPEKTREVFVPNPYTDEAGYERMYKTGDVVRLLPDGNLEYIGRRDSQVKIRGFRVELTEVEEVIRRFDGVKDAAVAAFDDSNGGKYIAAYVTGDGRIDTERLNAFIRAEKPSYMVPAVTMQLDAVPYTQNHKVNRRALPVPVRVRRELSEQPATEAERTVSAIAAKTLGHEDFDVLSDLFDAGLTSIGALRFNTELSRAFGKAVRISDIRDRRNVREIAAFLEENTGASVQYSMASDYPLMQNQTGVFLDSLDGESVKYNVPLLMKISDGLDAERLRKAVCAAIDAHPYIKATLFSDESGNVRAHRNDSDEPCAEIRGVSALPETKELLRPFTVVGGRLYRAEIYITDSGKYLFLDFHHIIADGTAVGILLNDISRAYAGEQLMSESFTGFECALEEEKVIASDEYQKSEKYFETLLDSCSTECLPEKCPENGAPAGGCAEYRFTFDSCSERIGEFCEKNSLSANAFFNAVFSYTLSEFLHTDDVTYCTVYNGRNDSRLAECFAMLVKTLPVRCVVNTKSAVADFVRSMQKQLISTMANDTVAFSNLKNKYGLSADIFFNYQGDNFIFDRIGGERAEAVPLEMLSAKAPLSVEVFLHDGVYNAVIGYRTDCFCREFVSSFADALAAAAEGFTCAARLSAVSVLSASEAEFFETMNSTNMPFDQVPAHIMFEKQVKAHPDRIAAAVSGGRKLTYEELDAAANAVANFLIARGAGNGEIIGLILNRSELVPAAEIGILKAGCAFLPMLPTYPDDRLSFCLEDAECRFAVSERDIIDSRKELFSSEKAYSTLCLEDMLDGGNTSQPEVIIGQNQAAYCIYTSGSTGTPKGVVIEHHSLTNFVQTAALREVETMGTAVLCMASISFDMSITEMFFSMCQGKTLYIASEDEIHNPDRLLSAFKEHCIDIIMMTPSFAWNLMSIPEFEAALSQLKGVVLGAEAFRPVLLSRLKTLNPEMLVQNGYGPTECTQVCSVKTLTEGGNITIGSPFANTKFYVTDENGNLLPRYAVGELVICGEGVCRGYINQPEKNAASFFELDGVRAYRSGDRVRINRDGEAEFGGRTDNQVKLRGFRIELDEVEAVMQEFDGVTQSKVIVRNNGSEDFLAGFFTADRAVDTDELSAFMKSKLTYYMVPAALMQLDKMPMTPNGKLDKKALPEISPVRKARAKRAPKKSLEDKILEVFRAVLNSDDCYVEDNFFEAGGTSLSASKAVMQIKAEGYKIEYQDIFDHQTAEELAEYLESLSAPPAASTQKGKESSLVEQDEGIAELLKYNAMEYAADVKREELGTVLLTGATGFLGIHILKTLLDIERGRIICIMRKGRYDDIETRLKATLVYYFEDDFADAVTSRVTFVEGDITDDNLSEMFRDIDFDTLINCAACVKHYANDNSIEFVNVHGVENLIRLTKEKGARMIQISTTSVPGAHTEETYRVNLRMAENQLFVVDDMNNQYCQSKYHSELRMLEAIREGMRGKIIRVGNLMGRYSDGEFQTNLRTNAFLNGLRGFVNIGKCPYSHATDPMRFSPIDCTAKAVVLLAGTNDKFTAFHADSRAVFDELKIIDAINRCGIKVTPVSDEEYYADFYRMMGDPKMNEKVSALLTNDRPDMHMIDTDNRFTVNVLYRLGFSWPFIDDDYLEKVIMSLDTLDFFFMDS